MKSIKLNIHSFIDIITNSSTEIYVAASQHTIDSIHKLVNSILGITNSQLKSEDLFDISLDKEDEEETNSWDDYPSSVGVIVTPKNLEDENYKIAANILGRLTSLFDIEARYDG